jgi:hypothetical protein
MAKSKSKMYFVVSQPITIFERFFMQALNIVFCNQKGIPCAWKQEDPNGSNSKSYCFSANTGCKPVEGQPEGLLTRNDFEVPCAYREVLNLAMKSKEEIESEMAALAAAQGKAPDVVEVPTLPAEDMADLVEAEPAKVDPQTEE